MFRYYYGFDIYYLVLILPAMLLGLWAQARVNSTFNRYSHVRCRQGYTGSQIARRILDANGLTDLGAAFLELNDKLSKNGFMDRGAASSGFYAPVILLLSDGEPTDDYLTALKKLQQNKWYQAALKIAIAIGEDANREVLKKAIRNVELLFTVNDIGSLKKIIRFIAVTSSQIASTSATVSEDSAEAPADVKDVRSTSAEHQMAEAAKVMLEEEKESAYSSIESTEESPEPMILGSDDSDDDDEWD